MKKTVFEHLDYKQYIRSWIEARPNKGHGERARIAQALRCQMAYVSQVLNGSAHLSLEQAELLNPYLGHTQEESEFFLNLVLYARAGTPSLKHHFERLLRQAVERRMVLKNRLEFKKTLAREDQALYYSAWHYAAVHVLVSVPGYRDLENISRYLGVSKKKVSSILEFLLATGLVIREKGEFRIGPTSLHLGNDSPLISKHHTNWRMQAIAALDREVPNELHYSSVITVSRADAEKIRALLVSAIEQVRPVVRESRDEAMYCYSLDLFEVGRRGD